MVLLRSLRLLEEKSGSYEYICKNMAREGEEEERNPFSERCFISLPIGGASYVGNVREMGQRECWVPSPSAHASGKSEFSPLPDGLDRKSRTWNPSALFPILEASKERKKNVCVNPVSYVAAAAGERRRRRMGSELGDMANNRISLLEKED